MKKALRILVLVLLSVVFFVEGVLLYLSFSSEAFITENVLSYGSLMGKEFVESIHISVVGPDEIKKIAGDFETNLKNSEEVKKFLQGYLRSLEDPRFYQEKHYELKADALMKNINEAFIKKITDHTGAGTLWNSIDPDIQFNLQDKVKNFLLSTEQTIFDVFNQKIQQLYEEPTIRMGIQLYSTLRTIWFRILLIILILLELGLLYWKIGSKSILILAAPLLVLGVVFRFLLAPIVDLILKGNHPSWVGHFVVPQGAGLTASLCIVIAAVFLLAEFLWLRFQPRPDSVSEETP